MTPEEAILSLLARRAQGKTICPSEAARLLSPDNWRPRMGEVREAAAKLAEQGRVVVTQKGAEVDALAVKGPIRVGHPKDR